MQKKLPYSQQRLEKKSFLQVSFSLQYPPSCPSPKRNPKSGNRFSEQIARQQKNGGRDEKRKCAGSFPHKRKPKIPQRFSDNLRAGKKRGKVGMGGSSLSVIPFACWYNQPHRASIFIPTGFMRRFAHCGG
jgi:hypothetical protein